jgi:hypothetical protein
VGLRRRLILIVAVSATAFAWAGSALAGSGLQPEPGATTGTQPTFLVSLDPQDSAAQVYVAPTPDMSPSFVPVHALGNCTPNVPASVAGQFTCQPTAYGPSSAASLAPGTYYWWLTFWRTDTDHPAGAQELSGPFTFTVAPPVPPADTYLVSPADGATSPPAPKLTIHAPAGAALTTFVSTSSAMRSDDSPVGSSVASCSGTTGVAGKYFCQPTASELKAGSIYYWWVVITVAGSKAVVGPRSFTIKAAHDVTYAPLLPSSDHYSGGSVKQSRLSQAAYGLSKALGHPKAIAVACWGGADWANISGQNPESEYTILGFHLFGSMPHWVDLSPGICHTFETLLYHRPKFANVVTANALDTLTHEMLHALGVRNEAQTECFAMQLSFVTGVKLGLPLAYAENLDRLSLRNYFSHPPAYVDRERCREGGAWDLTPHTLSLPWHMTGI